MTTLNELTKDKLAEIIQNFGRRSRIFYREAQFQFELAWEIQKIFEDNSCQVYLESIKNIDKDEGGREKKRYTDIVIEDKNRNYIAIELKYKTKQGEGDCKELKTHAAQDLGRYDFLWDTCRNEQLIQNGNNRYGMCIKGFSILLTNDSCYWEKAGEKYIYKNFSLKEGNQIPQKQNLIWNYTKSKEQLIASVGAEREKHIINLLGDYQCKWLPYQKNNPNCNFQFLVFESSK